MDLWNRVIEQLRKDIEEGEVMPMYEMLQRVPKDVLIAYLPESDEETTDV